MTSRADLKRQALEAIERHKNPVHFPLTTGGTATIAPFMTMDPAQVLALLEEIERLTRDHELCAEYLGVSAMN